MRCVKMPSFQAKRQLKSFSKGGVKKDKKEERERRIGESRTRRGTRTGYSRPDCLARM